MTTDLSVVGKSLPRSDARIKAVGAARYCDDIIRPGMLFGKLLRSPVAHAKILNIDVSKAKKLPGVKSVITGNDTLKIRFGNWRLVPESQDELPLAVDKVRFIGDEVAAVAAIDKDIAEEALDLISVEYEELPGAFSVDESLAEGAPVIHQAHQNNISLQRNIDYGDLEQGFADSHLILDNDFTVHATNHAYMEPCSCVAEYDHDGRLTIWTSTQTPYFVQCLLAQTLGMRENDIRVIKPFVGGGFGGKMEMRKWEFAAAFMARETGRPVKFTLTRTEELATGRRRHPMKIRSKIGFKKDGTILAKEFTAHLDGGAYNSMGPTAAFLCGNFGGMLYRHPNYRYNGYHVYTNKPPAGAMRGFGAPQALFVAETQMNMAAKELGMDPLDIRLINAMVPGDEIPGVAKISSCGFKESLLKVAEMTNWREKRQNLKDGQGIGIGCYSFISGGVFNWFNTRYNFTRAEVRAFDDGTVHLLTMASDIGQGCDTVLRQILAEDLGLEIKDIRLTAADTAVTPQADLGTWGSRVTLMAGNAVRKAAAEIKEQLFKIVSMKFDLNVIHDMTCKKGRIYAKNRPDRGIAFGEAVRLAQRANRGDPIIGYGSYTPRNKGLVTPAFSFGAQVAELEVDMETGAIEVKEMNTAHDCGTPINPMSVEGQLEGSVHMGLGYALSEQYIMKGGKTLTSTFLDYKIPCAEDMPPGESVHIDTYEPEGPFGAKEAGEGLVSPTAPAIADAVWHATGYRCMNLPITPEKVLKGLDKL
ncbi:MAG: molybdopterin cofactor-binding domain-containing protein [Pseudomonadota bacterium]|nr:molybdopterin cofactor-binding domain-containing protein [Pseudomonadota bacterium]